MEGLYIQIKKDICENIQKFFLKHFPKKSYLADPISKRIVRLVRFTLLLISYDINKDRVDDEGYRVANRFNVNDICFQQVDVTYRIACLTIDSLKIQFYNKFISVRFTFSRIMLSH